MKVAIVVQRFGKDVIGGAESHAYQLAEKLSQLPQLSIEVLTTTAKSSQTWANVSPRNL